MSTRSLRAVLFAFAMLIVSSTSFAQVRISVSFGPPALPVYVQPICPGEGYIWTPGYWAWADDYDDYYWVPGTWVLAPEPGFLWTPPYWGWASGSYVFYHGYWGPHVGFYGGINYGFGYFGEGFEGGRWEGNRFYYNRAVTHVNVTVVHNVYNTKVVYRNTTINRVSYNGGNGGINARPTAQQESWEHERHISPVAAQTQHIEAARGNSQFRAGTNRGKPPVAATARPGQFSGRDVVRARAAGAPYSRPANRPSNQPREEGASSRPNVTHPRDLPPMQRPASPNTGNARLDQKYQQQQQKLQQKQDQERQKLQQKQERDHQQLERRNADQGRRQQFEQRHEQQTQKLEQRHEQQQQKLQQRQTPSNRSESKPRRGGQ